MTEEKKTKTLEKEFIEITKKYEKYQKKYDENEKTIDALIEENRQLGYKMSECEQALYEFKYRGFELKVNGCYFIDNPNYYYHDVKKQIVKIDAIDGVAVACTKYILKDNDGDEFFYIAKMYEDKFKLIDFLMKSKAELLPNEEAQEWINSYILVDDKTTPSSKTKKEKR